MNYHYFLHLVFPYSLLVYIYSKEEGKINKRLNSRFSSNEIRNQKSLGNPETILKKKRNSECYSDKVFSSRKPKVFY